jgi:hypothetical protein
VFINLVVMKKAIAIGVIVMIMLAGCGGEPGAQPSIEETDSEPSSDTPEGTTSTDESQSGAADSNRFTLDTPTDAILITKNELSDEYTLDNERQLTESGLSEGTAEQFEKHDMRLLHDRSFFNSDSAADDPKVIVSTVIVFESASAAETYQTTFVDQITGITAENTVPLANEKAAQELQFENQDGLRNVVVISQINNMVLYTTTSDPESYYPDTTRTLFLNSHRQAIQEAT